MKVDLFDQHGNMVATRVVFTIAAARVSTSPEELASSLTTHILKTYPCGITVRMSYAFAAEQPPWKK